MRRQGLANRVEGRDTNDVNARVPVLDCPVDVNNVRQVWYIGVPQDPPTGNAGGPGNPNDDGAGGTYAQRLRVWAEELYDIGIIGPAGQRLIYPIAANLPNGRGVGNVEQVDPRYPGAEPKMGQDQWPAGNAKRLSNPSTHGFLFEMDRTGTHRVNWNPYPHVLGSDPRSPPGK
jgi:hypothetical protein